MYLQVGKKPPNETLNLAPPAWRNKEPRPFRVGKPGVSETRAFANGFLLLVRQSHSCKTNHNRVPRVLFQLSFMFRGDLASGTSEIDRWSCRQRKEQNPCLSTHPSPRPGEDSAGFLWRENVILWTSRNGL